MIKKYRKKPVIIEAVQWLDTNNDWNAIIAMGLKEWSPGATGSKSFYIETLEGKMRVNTGDYVIKGIKGEFYPCKPDIFFNTYEEIS